MFGAGARNMRFTLSRGHGADVPEIVVLRLFPELHPAIPSRPSDARQCNAQHPRLPGTTAASLTGLGTADAVALTTAQIAALTTGQVTALATSQIARLGTTQVVALTTSSITAFTSA